MGELQESSEVDVFLGMARTYSQACLNYESKLTHQMGWDENFIQTEVQVQRS